MLLNRYFASSLIAQMLHREKFKKYKYTFQFITSLFFMQTVANEPEEGARLQINDEWRDLNIYGKRKLVIALFTNNSKCYL